MITERQAYLWLNHIKDMAPKTRGILIHRFNSPMEIFSLGEEMLFNLCSEGVIKQSSLEMMLLHKEEDWVLKYEEDIIKKVEDYITPADDIYPERLRQIYDAPAALFYRGDLNILKEKNVIGVVGSRNPTFYGKEMTRFLVSKVARDIVIVSGLAYGIDAAAHSAAIDSGGKTIGVLGCGINICYPRDNYYLYDEMCKEQLVITEFPPDTKPLGLNFPLRNRIISGLSKGILVIEAREKSGTLITADAALDQGRDIYAVPGRATDELSKGTNRLIRNGALLVTSPEELLEDVLGDEYLEYKTKKEKLKKEVIKYKNINNSKSEDDKKGSDTARENKIEIDGSGNNKNLNPLEESILSVLSIDPQYIDDIIIKTKVSVSDAISVLLSLKNKGLVEEVLQGYYAKKIIDG